VANVSNEARDHLDEPLLDVRQVAELLNVRPTTIREWVRAGRMPVLVLGPRAHRWTRSMLAEWASHQRQGGTRP
jgi:excisionase family DNA binding protein